MRTPQTYLKAVGTHVPDVVTVEAAAAAGLCEPGAFGEGGLSGAAVAGDVAAPELALRAARDALDRCGHPATDLDLVLYATTWPHGPEGFLPPAYVQDRLVGGGVLAVEIKQGCNGMFGALEIAASYLQAGSGRTTALLLAADNYGTSLMNRWATGGPFIPGDAASALVVSTEPGFAEVLAVGSLSAPDVDTDLAMLDVPLFPPGMTEGRAVDFTRRGGGAPDPAFLDAVVRRTAHARESLVEVVGRTLDEAGTTMADVARTCVVNVDRGFIEGRGMTAIGVDIAKTTWDYGRAIGHCGASDPVLGLAHLLRTGELAEGDRVLMVASGPSITGSAAVLRIVAEHPAG